MNAIRHINWVDIFCVILLIRVLYIAFKSGFVLEFFKLIGTVLAVYLSMHYCVSWAELFIRPFGIPNRNVLNISTFIAFVVLALLGYLIGFLLRILFSKMLKVEAHPVLNKWGGIVCGVVRSVLVTSLVVFTVTLSSMAYVHRKVAVSYIADKIVTVSPAAYRIIWKGLMHKLMPHERMNLVIMETSSKALMP
jgi:uncharacterized membrane protein required for colicin V production